MHSRGLKWIGILGAVTAAATFSVARVGGQSTSTPQTTWQVPRTPDGRPDLQGVWANNGVTPLERPKALAGKERLSQDEFKALKATADRLFDGSGDAAFGDSVFEAALAEVKGFTSRDAGTGNYNQFWLVERDWDDRTSLVIDPKDGRIPAMTPDAQARAQSRGERRKSHPADGPEDRSLSERCISFGVPRLGAGYNSYYQIVQSPSHVAVVMETIHDARIIPLDGRPHTGADIRQWHGDSRGRWEGDTLVVETANYAAKGGVMGATESLKVTERFTRVDDTRIEYKVTLDDPATWTKPWTAMIYLTKSPDKVFEFACHEGNSGMEGILAGHRAQERTPAKSAPPRGGAGRLTNP